MPYISDPDQETVANVRDRLLAVAVRHADTGDDPFMRIPRTKLHALAAPHLRKEDFYESIRRLAVETEAIREATGTGRRADVILDRVVLDGEVGEWETVLYEVFPDDEPEPEDVREYLAGRDLLSEEPIPTDLLVRRQPRPTVAHDPDVPRKCAKCGETKDTKHFGRRSADPEHPDYNRFQSYCVTCTREVKRTWAAKHGDAREQRPERWVQGKYSRPGGRRPRSASTSTYRFTN